MLIAALPVVLQLTAVLVSPVPVGRVGWLVVGGDGRWRPRLVAATVAVDYIVCCAGSNEAPALALAV